MNGETDLSDVYNQLQDVEGTIASASSDVDKCLLVVVELLEKILAKLNQIHEDVRL